MKILYRALPEHKHKTYAKNHEKRGVIYGHPPKTGSSSRPDPETVSSFIEQGEAPSPTENPPPKKLKAGAGS